MATYLATVQIGRYRDWTAEPALTDVPLRLFAPADLDADGFDGRLRPAARDARGLHRAVRPLPVRRRTPWWSPATTSRSRSSRRPCRRSAATTCAATGTPPGWSRTSSPTSGSATRSRWRAGRTSGCTRASPATASGCGRRSRAASPPTTRAQRHWKRLADLDQDLLLADPGPDLMFDDRVYKRGALTLHALRTDVGDDAFFGLLRRWVADHARRLGHDRRLPGRRHAAHRRRRQGVAGSLAVRAAAPGAAHRLNVCALGQHRGPGPSQDWSAVQGVRRRASPRRCAPRRRCVAGSARRASGEPGDDARDDPTSAPSSTSDRAGRGGPPGAARRWLRRAVRPVTKPRKRRVVPSPGFATGASAPSSDQ